ncbi:MAG: hypothetical protein AAF573_19690 [Bacteroidota bacterium]
MSTNRVRSSGASPFRDLNILYLALLLGQLMIVATMIFILQGEEIGFSFDVSNVFHLVGVGVMMTNVTLANFLYSKRIEEARKQKGLASKFEHYRATMILRSALLEGAGLMCIVFFFLEKNYFFLILFLLGLAVFILVRPSKQFFKEKYKLTEEERMQFKKW